ncbi:MAG TPA: molybdate ABC transporter substrate-binding protein [Paracoccaceae bacterium]
MPRGKVWKARRLVLGLLAAAGMALPLGRGARAADVPQIAAASDLQFALEEIIAEFAAETGREVRATYGSSGNFYTQIRQGAPFQMFMSADMALIGRLHDEGLTTDRGRPYAIGRVVLFAPKGSDLVAEAAADDPLAGLRAALAAGQVTRFAIANPDHAPYGRAAAEVLRGQGLWAALEPKLVLGENVAQAAQFASSGAAQGGIFAYSLALSPQMGALGEHVLLPAEWHAPLLQGMAVMKGADEATRAFYDYVQQPAAREIFRRHGFVLPGETN